jgi:ketosteroid isomerase-like protein
MQGQPSVTAGCADLLHGQVFPVVVIEQRRRQRPQACRSDYQRAHHLTAHRDRLLHCRKSAAIWGLQKWSGACFNTGVLEEFVTPSHEEDAARVRRRFECLAEHVRAVDFEGARPIFAADMIAFGTFTDFMTGRDKAEAAQWRNVWPHIDEFRWRPDIRTIVSPDRLTAIGMAIFDSTGYSEDGKPYARPGRATVVFARKALDGDWVALHTHMSLFRDVPTRSFKSKPEKTRGRRAL